MNMWKTLFRDIGRKQVGEEIHLSVQTRNPSRTPTASTAAPTFRIYSDAGTNVLNGSLPPTERYAVTGLFEFAQRLTSAFSAGRYFVRYQYAISGTNYCPPIDFFEVLAGGSSSGTVISMAYLDRPDGNDWIVTQTDSGATTINRGPHV